MKAIKNMQKITKAMKMVSAAKMRGDQNRLDIGVPFAQPVLDLFERLPREAKPGPMSILAMTSDKGLCGGVNSQVNKATRNIIADTEAAGETAKYMGMGGKGPTALKRLFADRYDKTFEEVAKIPFSYLTACIVAERLISANPTRLTLIYNWFKNVAVYRTQTVAMVTKDDAKTIDKLEWSKAMDVYTFEPSIFEVWDDLHEFYFSCAIFQGYLNNVLCEQSQRMSAMENASKNAGEVLEKVTIQYNRARQAKITTELCEIISGASVVG
jgi:F-type H+-transporting ATPase subunit gamma